MVSQKQYAYFIVGLVLALFAIAMLTVARTTKPTETEEFLLYLVSATLFFGGVSILLHSITLKRVRRGYGIQVTSHFRNFLNYHLDLPWKECERYGELLDKDLHDADWLSLDSGQTYDQTWPVLRKDKED